MTYDPKSELTFDPGGFIGLDLGKPASEHTYELSVDEHGMTFPRLIDREPVGPAPAGGVKHDSGKLRMDLVPADALMDVARVMTRGAVKYGDRNWERGIAFGRLYAAMLRHVFAWWAGEDGDPETGEPHLAHAACCALMLLALAGRPGADRLDDRPGHPASAGHPAAGGRDA